MDTEDAARIDFAIGQIQALIAVVAASIESHPNLPDFKKRFDATTQAAIAIATPASVSDDYMEGLNDATDRLQKVLRRALEQR